MGQIGARRLRRSKAVVNESAIDGSADKQPIAFNDPIPF
jgi:hypothetical protein